MLVLTYDPFLQRHFADNPASCYVDESAQIIGDVVLGEHASVWMNAVVRGDVHAIRIGAYSNIQDCSVLHGMKEQYGVYLGEYVTVGHTVTLHGCTIEDRCLIGMGSIILNGARIGAGSIIAAGTLIPEKTVVEPGSLWMGSPGKFRRKLEPADTRAIMRYARNYLGYKDAYLAERAFRLSIQQSASNRAWSGVRYWVRFIHQYFVILSEFDLRERRSNAVEGSQRRCSGAGVSRHSYVRGVIRVHRENSLTRRIECRAARVLRLRSCFALRSSYFAQDDS